MNIGDIGSADNTALLCHTNRPPLDGNMVHSGGDWFAPSKTRVHSTDVPGFSRNRDPMVVRLKRANGNPANGIYYCVIQVEGKETFQQFHVGLYSNGEGKISHMYFLQHIFLL